MKIRFYPGGLLLLAALGLTGCSTVLALRFGKFRQATQNVRLAAPFWGLLSGAGGL